MASLKRLLGILRQYFRKKRYAKLSTSLSLESLSGFILDLGGGPASFFSAIFPYPEQVIMVEIDCAEAYKAKQNRSSLHVIVADGQRLPLADQSIEATICNSVIEHVAAPQQLAYEIQRVSKQYFLQTPNQNFPIESHSYIPIPFFQLIPFIWLRRFVTKLFGGDFDYISSVRYVSEKQLRNFFPEAQVSCETAIGLKKSFYVQSTRKNGDSRS